MELRRGHWAYPDCHDSKLRSASHASLQTSSLPGSGSGSISPPPRCSTWLWVQAAHQSLKSRQCPLPWPSRTFHSCLLLWAPVGSGYQEPLHPPCAAYSYHRPMKVSWPPSSPWQLLIVCAPGVPHQPGHSGRATGQPGEGPHSSGPKHSSSGVLQQTNQSGSAASGVPLGLACGCGLHSPDTPTSCTSVLTQPRWEPRSA